MAVICPECGGHEMLQCRVGISECCPDCTVSRDTTTEAFQEFSCYRCGTFFVVEWATGVKKVWTPDTGRYGEVS